MIAKLYTPKVGYAFYNPNTNQYATSLFASSLEGWIEVEYIEYERYLYEQTDEYLNSDEYKIKSRREYLDSLQLSRSTFIQLVIYCTSILPVPITLATIKQVSTMSEDADILFNYSNFIVRGTPLLTAVCKQYGVSEDMLDAMFEFSNELLTMKTDNVPFNPTLLINL